MGQLSEVGLPPGLSPLEVERVGEAVSLALWVPKVPLDTPKLTEAHRVPWLCAYIQGCSPPVSSSILSVPSPFCDRHLWLLLCLTRSIPERLFIVFQCFLY